MKKKKYSFELSRMIFRNIFYCNIFYMPVKVFMYEKKKNIKKPRSRKTNRNLVVLMKIAAVHKAQKHAFKNFRLNIVFFCREFIE